MILGYLDCFAGASGDMVLGALIAAGVPREYLSGIFLKLSPGMDLEVSRRQSHGITATSVRIIVPPAEKQRDHRTLQELLELLAAASLDPAIQHKAEQVLRRIAQAEATVHGVKPEEVHFHELGGLDSLADIVGAVAGFHHLGIVQLFSSPMPVGSGAVKTHHGLLPVPAPATAELLKGVPTAAHNAAGELVTPTGAGIVTTLAQGFGSFPAMTIRSVGYGCGRSEFEIPNILRLFVGDREQAPSGLEGDSVAVLESNVDDMPAEWLAYTVEAAMTAGALDAFITPVLMKHGRPGHLITVLAPPDRISHLAESLFQQTTTFGLRVDIRNRFCLPREVRTVNTPYGSIRVKLALRNGLPSQASPEFRDCEEAARRCGVPLKVVYQAALHAMGLPGEEGRQ